MSLPFGGTNGRGDGLRGRGRGGAFRGQGKDRSSPRGWRRGGGPSGRGRGRRFPDTTHDRYVSLAEHASGSSIPLHRRHRIYLPMDEPRDQSSRSNASQDVDGVQDRSESRIPADLDQASDIQDDCIDRDGGQQNHTWMSPEGPAPILNGHNDEEGWSSHGEEISVDAATDTAFESEDYLYGIAPESNEAQDFNNTVLNDDHHPPFIQRFKSSSSSQKAPITPPGTIEAPNIPALHPTQPSATEHGSEAGAKPDSHSDTEDLMIFEKHPQRFTLNHAARQGLRLTHEERTKNQRARFRFRQREKIKKACNQSSFNDAYPAFQALPIEERASILDSRIESPQDMGESHRLIDFEDDMTSSYHSATSQMADSERSAEDWIDVSDVDLFDLTPVPKGTTNLIQGFDDAILSDGYQAPFILRFKPRPGREAAITQAEGATSPLTHSLGAPADETTSSHQHKTKQTIK